LHGLFGALALTGLALAMPGCGADAASSDSALNNTPQVSAPASVDPSLPASADLFNLDGYSSDPTTGDPKGGGTTGGGGSTGGGGTTDPLCTSTMDGGTTSCKDEATWKDTGTKFCAMKGGTLKSITFNTSCGRGYWREAVYNCCVTPTPPPPPPPPSCGCTTNKEGSGMDCKSRDDWKTEAAKVCAAKGQVLTRIDYHDPCGCDKYKDIDFECCGMTPPPPPPPPPPTCTDGHGTCMICQSEADWRKEIETECAKSGSKVGTVSFGPSCSASPMGPPGYNEAKWQCCK